MMKKGLIVLAVTLLSAVSCVKATSQLLELILGNIQPVELALSFEDAGGKNVKPSDLTVLVEGKEKSVEVKEVTVGGTTKYYVIFSAGLPDLSDLKFEKISLEEQVALGEKTIELSLKEQKTKLTCVYNVKKIDSVENMSAELLYIGAIKHASGEIKKDAAHTYEKCFLLTVCLNSEGKISSVK